MFKSLFSLFGQVIKIFSGFEKRDFERKDDSNDTNTDDTSTHAEVDSVEGSDPSDSPLQFDVEDVKVLSGDWGNSVPQRASALFPQTLPKLVPQTSELEEPDPTIVKEVTDRETPSPDRLFAEARADLVPSEPLERPDRPLPKSVMPEALPVIPPAPSSQHYSAHVQVGRLMKQDPEPPAEYPKLNRPPEIIHSGKKGRQRLIQSLYDQNPHHNYQPHSRGAWDHNQLPPPPRGVQRPVNPNVAYHDIEGDRGASSRVQYANSSFNQVDVFSDNQLPEHIINRGLRPAAPTSLLELAPPPLKPKPVRFKHGNYLRFWGNYSAQPSYLHFGSLIRSERFIELLPIWYNELDELETEAHAEWSYLEDESPLEGEADWRRLLNPTTHSPIEFLLQRDRIEQINLLPRGR